MATGQETLPGGATKAEIVEVPAPVVLRGVRYGDYVRLVRQYENRHLRMTYHDGTLEIMSPEYIHERPSTRLGVLIRVVCEELDITYEGTASTTFRRGEDPTKKKGKGKEPDESFYFANATRILGKERIDLDAGDPPPDLWIEVDHRSSSRGKLPVYAALGVPEVWRYRAATKRLRFVRLAADRGTYEAIERSLCLPMLTPSLVQEALALGDGLLESAWTRLVREWARRKLTATGGDATGPGE
jgi:Uma2 family endonuclease